MATSSARTPSPTRMSGGVEIPSAGTYTIDSGHTAVRFVVRNMLVSKTWGRLPSVSGSIMIGDHPLDSAVEVSIDTTDVDTGNKRRDAHLRSPDFFEYGRFPNITYRSTAVRAVRPERWQVAGDLTVRDVTRPVTLEATFEGGLIDAFGNTRIEFSAVGEVDRYDLGVTWSHAFGGIVVARKVMLEIEVGAFRAA